MWAAASFSLHPASIIGYSYSTGYFTFVGFRTKQVIMQLEGALIRPLITSPLAFNGGSRTYLQLIFSGVCVRTHMLVCTSSKTNKRIGVCCQLCVSKGKSSIVLSFDERHLKVFILYFPPSNLSSERIQRFRSSPWLYIFRNFFNVN